MLQKKYIIIIAIIVCLFILYYFYDEIASIKKLSVPTYQKTMSLEMRVAKLESKTIPNKQLTKKIDSPLTITYQSDKAKNGTLSAKYIEVSESEANQLLKNIEQNKSNNVNPAKIIVGEFSDNNDITKKLINDPDVKINKQKNLDLDFEASDTINVKIADLIKKNVNIIKSDTPTAEYKKIYDTLNTAAIIPKEEDDNFDADIINDISESIQYADIPSENTVSDIPVKPKARTKNKKLVTKKSQKISAKNNK